MALPEWLRDTGRSECPADGGQLNIFKLFASLSWNIHERHGQNAKPPKAWFDHSGLGLTFDRKVASDRGVSIEELSATTKQVLEERAGIRRVWTEAEIVGESSETAELYRRSYDPERSADLYLELDPTCLLRRNDVGTTHGSPHLYDRAVPLVFMGPGVEPGMVDGVVGTLSIAPTLLEVMDLPAVEGLDGSSLDLGAPAN
jgi:hypothetical protein